MRITKSGDRPGIDVSCPLCGVKMLEIGKDGGCYVVECPRHGRMVLTKEAGVQETQ
jgi:uncharacterized Zn finger protein (UPF0148 family)